MKYYPPRFLFRRFELLKRIGTGSSFLEIGPGSLNLAEDMLNSFSRGVLVDYNPELKTLFNNLRPELRARLSLVISDFSCFYNNEKFSAVIACEVMEHIEDDGAFLAKTFSMLQDNGLLLISVPARKKFWSVHDEGVGHLRRYERAQLRNLLDEAGFSDIEVVSYGYPFVNILRIPRILLAGKQKTQNMKLTTEQQTRESGVSQYKIMSRYFGLICNRFTLLPLSLFSSLFNRLDLSNGYIATARRSNEK